MYAVPFLTAVAWRCAKRSLTSGCNGQLENCDVVLNALQSLVGWRRRFRDLSGKIREACGTGKLKEFAVILLLALIRHAPRNLDRLGDDRVLVRRICHRCFHLAQLFIQVLEAAEQVLGISGFCVVGALKVGLLGLEGLVEGLDAFVELALGELVADGADHLCFEG